MKMPEEVGRLLLTCSDQRGIVAAVASFLADHGANILALEQHAAPPPETKLFMRVEFRLPAFVGKRSRIEEDFSSAVAGPLGMRWRMAALLDRRQVAILVSKADHALLELLWRWRRGELPAEVTMVISNHEDLRREIEEFRIPYHHVAVTPEAKLHSERRILELLDGRADLVVLARYMQVFSSDVLAHYPERMINIHHSFLPAFQGARPYQQAYERGVKLIGATAHYVNEDLDAGPIIEQDVARITHRHRLSDVIALGRDLERQVLTRAVRWHLEDRIIVDGAKTVVFV